MAPSGSRGERAHNPHVLVFLNKCLLSCLLPSPCLKELRAHSPVCRGHTPSHAPFFKFILEYLRAKPSSFSYQGGSLPFPPKSWIGFSLDTCSQPPCLTLAPYTYSSLTLHGQVQSHTYSPRKHFHTCKLPERPSPHTYLLGQVCSLSSCSVREGVSALPRATCVPSGE